MNYQDWQSSAHDAWGIRAQAQARRIARDRFWHDLRIMAGGAAIFAVLLGGALWVWVAT